MIPYGRQDITPEDIKAVVDVLQSDFLTQGPKIAEFESEVTTYCKVAHAVAVNSATSALHIACLALGVGPGDWVWTSPITFVASANCARYCGANVDFVDIDPQTFNISADALREKLILARERSKLPKVVIPVHMAGQSCDMAAIKELASEFGFLIIEDASHAIGGRYLGQPVGGCQYSDIAIFSFHPVKIITTGEGGMALTNNKIYADRMRLLRSHCVTRDASQMTELSAGAWYYEQIGLGYNYRMTDLQAALGISQMQRLDRCVEARHTIAKRYEQMLSGMPLVLPTQRNYSYSSFHLYVVQIDCESHLSRRFVFDALRSAGIGVNVHYIPVHTQPYYQKLGQQVGYDAGSFLNANKYYERAISLPMYASLTMEAQDTVVDALGRIMKCA